MINEFDGTQNGEDSVSKSEKMNELSKQLETCMSAQKEWQERFLRLNADFENYKKRVAKDQALWIDTAQVQLLKKLLPIVDDIERAFAQPLPTETSQQQTWLAGFSMIKESVAQFLKNSGVEEIAAAGVFDPELHEAIAQVVSPEHSSGTIVAVLQKGYKFKDTVLRPARVSVAQ